MQLPQGGCRGTCWFEEDTGIAVTKRVRRNEEIDGPEVRVIDSEGEQKGVMPVAQAIVLAKVADRMHLPADHKKFLPVLGKIAGLIDENSGEVTVSGHTDNVPISNERFRSNWELSTSRAVSVAHELLKTATLDEERFIVTGHADTRPRARPRLCSGHSSSDHGCVPFDRRAPCAGGRAARTAARPGTARPDRRFRL